MKEFLLAGIIMMVSSCMSKIETPKILEGNKSHTLNGTGYIFFTQSKISNKFLEEECIAGKTVLEIGAGFGDLPIKALEKGVDEYYVNDISDEHLNVLSDKVRSQVPDKINKLKMINGAAPGVMRNIDQKFDAIIADKVIHFLNPNEIIEFLTLAKTLLKENGKLYITSASPYSKRYNAMLGEYLMRKSQGELFPGYFSNIMKRLNESEEIDKNYKNYQVPDSMVLFTKNDLVNLVERHEMRVTHSYSFKIPTAENPDWMICQDPEGSLVGVIAVK
jgi:ubiquinone/menaquinone biosynthesis C-methylase UbiE